MGNSETDIDYEITIVGSGPAGISTWLHLNKNHPELATKILIIEKSKHPRDKLCGRALGGWTEYILDDLNIKLNIPSVKINSANCIFGKELYEHKEENFFKIIRRSEFDNLLLQNAKKQNLKIHENEEFLDVNKYGNYLKVKTNKDTYKTKVLIGADGALSKVRRKMKVNAQPHLAPTIEVFSPVKQQYDPEFQNKSITIDFSPIFQGIQGYIWHFPCIIKGKQYMNHGIGDFKFHKIKPKIKLKDTFYNTLKDRKIDYEEHKCKGHPICWLSEKDIISAPNVFLIGDAAGIDPAIGGGIHLALSYGDLASQTIIEAFETNDFTFKNYKEKLNKHLVGRYINKLTYLADKMYGKEISPLEVIKEIFSKKR